jgi:pilus assembly protein CpaE
MNKESRFKPFSILVTGTEETLQCEAARVLERSAKFFVQASSPANIVAKEKVAGVDAVVVGFKSLGDNELDLLNAISANLEGVPVIVVSDHLDEKQVRELIKRHVQDWLTHPLDESAFVRAIDTCVRISKTTQNKVHAVVSGEAGAGSTVVAASFADYLATEVVERRENVALFDLDFSTGSSGYILNMVNTFDLKNVLSHPGRIDFEFVNLIRETHRRGFHVFSFKRPELLIDSNGSELVLRMLDVVNIQNNHTVLDIPYYQTDWRDDVLSAVNTCTVVTELNLPALRQALDTVREVQSIRGASFPVRILLNKYKRHLFGGGLGTKDVRELFGNIPISLLPYSDGLIEESLNRGVLPAEIHPHSAFVRGVRKYVDGLLVEGEAGK